MPNMLQIGASRIWLSTFTSMILAEVTEGVCISMWFIVYAMRHRSSHDQLFSPKNKATHVLHHSNVTKSLRMGLREALLLCHDTVTPSRRSIISSQNVDPLVCPRGPRRIEPESISFCATIRDRYIGAKYVERRRACKTATNSLFLGSPASPRRPRR